jgi:hypothetical protein
MPSAFPFDQFDEAGVDFSLGAILDDEALALAGAPQAAGSHEAVFGSDRIVAFLRDRLEARQALISASAIAMPCGNSGRAPADALGVKQEFEKALAQDNKPTT